MVNISESLNKLKKTRWFQYFLCVLVLVGTVMGSITSYLQSSSNNTNQLLQTTIISYITAIVGLIFIIAISIKFRSMKLTSLGQPVTIFSSYILYSLPSVVTIAILAYICYILLAYRDQLMDGRVASEYYTYSTAGTILVSIQSCLLLYYIYQQVQSIHFGKEYTKNSLGNYGIYMLSVLNLIILGISQVILQFFSTDG